MKRRIYLDNNGSTCVDPRVLEAVIQGLQTCVGNPSSIHTEGQFSRQRLTQARQRIAEELSVQPNEIIFNSGGTEGINTILRGVVQAYPHAHIITSDAEHSCVYNTLQLFQEKGSDVTVLPAGLWGAVTPEAVKAALRPTTRLIALMAVNNETGVKTDIEAIAAIAEEAGIFFLVDGVALLGKESFSIPSGVSAMCFSGHKFHAPKGVGFLIWRPRLKIPSLITGGAQEFNRRAGTENLPGIEGLVEAVSCIKGIMPEASDTMRRMRDRLEQGLLSQIPAAYVNGQGPRVVNTANISFSGVDGEALLINLDRKGIAVSHGSACSSGALEPSRILLKMGVPLQEARSAIRFSLSRFTTVEEIDYCIETVVQLIATMKRK